MGPTMGKMSRHILIPATLPVAFWGIASLPVEVLGCRGRGLAAALVAIAAGILGVAAAVKALVGRMRGDPNSFLWMASALILAIPAVLIALRMV
jgi:hypothetical protein